MAAKRATKPATVKAKTTRKTSAVKSPVKKARAAKPESVINDSVEERRFSNMKLNPGSTQRITLLLSLVLLIAAIAYFSRGLFIAATVNGQPISRLELIRQLEQENGKTMMENLITKKLILQEARNKGVSVTQQEIDAEIENIRSSIEAQGSTLEDALSFEGKTIENLREAILLDLTVEKTFGEGTEVTDEEVLAYYEENKEMIGEQSFEDIKDDLKTNLKKQEIYNNYSTWLTTAKTEANINYFVNF